jgi:Protein of unknown function (DUF2946)
LALLDCWPMFARRTFRQLTAWLATLALLLGGLLPVLSHAVVSAPANGQGWVEVCTVSGMAWVKPAVADTNAANVEGGAPLAHSMPGSPLTMDRCEWCAAHNPLAGVPLLASPLAAPLEFGSCVLPRFFHAPRPLFVWAAARSRAPPVSA